MSEHCSIGVCSRINFAAKAAEEYVSLLSINFPYPKNASICWIGVLKNFHRQGIGKQLVKEAFHQAKTAGARTISVKNLSPQEGDENYLKTYYFYKSLGFFPLFNLKPQGYDLSMVYIVKILNPG